MKTLRVLAVLVALLPACAWAQSDTVTVNVTDRTNLGLTITTALTGWVVGDTVTFRAEAIDSITGDTLDVVLEWSTTTPAVLDLDPATGFGTFLGCPGSTTCTADVIATVQRIVSLAIFREGDDGLWREVFTLERRDVYASTGVVPESLMLDMGEEFQLCAYLVNDLGVLLSRSASVCPANVLGNGGRGMEVWLGAGPLPIDPRLAALVG